MRLRLLIGVLLLTVFSVRTSLQMFVSATARVISLWRLSAAPVDDSLRFEDRCEDLKRQLPAYGSVGYRSDLPRHMDEEGRLLPEDVVRFEKDYFLTQYALTPLVVDQSITTPTAGRPVVLINTEHRVELLPAPKEN